MSSSIFNDNSISISVSDDDSDELGRMRFRVRRKRKKRGHQRVRTDFTQRLIRWFVKYWAHLIILPAAVLLIFEATRISRKPGLVVNSKPNFSGYSELTKVKELSQGKKSDSDLNRLDPTTHVVYGFRERCLKLLPAEELEHLDIPLDEESSRSPVKKLVYISGHKTPYAGGNSSLSWQRTNGTRFNLFTGNQTLDESRKALR